MKLFRQLFRILMLSTMIFALMSCGQKKKKSNQIESDSTQVQHAAQINSSKKMHSQQVTVKINKKQPFGQYLTDGYGRSLYLFLKDTAGKSKCYDACSGSWPAFEASNGSINAGQGVDSTLIGKVKRKDGSMQVTYNGHPLYHYQKDMGAGDVKGQDFKQFGAEWYLVKPNGKKMGDVE